MKKGMKKVVLCLTLLVVFSSLACAVELCCDDMNLSSKKTSSTFVGIVRTYPGPDGTTAVVKEYEETWVKYCTNCGAVHDVYTKTVYKTVYI